MSRNASPAQAAAASPPRSELAGDSASPQATQRLRNGLKRLKTISGRQHLEHAVECLRRGAWDHASQAALKALEADERNGHAWWVLAIAREKSNDLASALSCYDKALILLPDHAAIAHDLGRLAFLLDQKETAAKLFWRFLAQEPGHPEAVNNLACALRDLNAHDEAIEALKPVLQAHPDQTMLWNTLGTIRVQQGELASAVGFYDEALRLDPAYARARYNRGNARLNLGDAAGALEDIETALALAEPGDGPMMALAQASAKLASGEIGSGWDAYEARLDPRLPAATRFLSEGARWTPHTPLSGRRLLVFGEQGLGDEVMFASVLPELVSAVGPSGKVVFAVEARLQSLFARSFPQVEVGSHRTARRNGATLRDAPFAQGENAPDIWVPLASLLRQQRRDLTDFRQGPYLAADPGRTAAWRDRIDRDLGRGRLRVGILWKSLKMDPARSVFFAPFPAWRPVFDVQGIDFVALQYGDWEEEALAARALGVTLYRPDLDLKDDLDGVAALCVALDLVVGPANATTNIAAACGAETWFISEPGAWPRLGADRLPWYPSARAFVPDALGRWEGVMADVAASLAMRLSSQDGPGAR